MTAGERADYIHKVDDEGMVVQTRELCEAYLRDFPEDGIIWIILAENLRVLHLYEESWAALDRAERLTGESRKKKRLVLLHRGYLFTDRGDHLRAEEYFMEAHALCPEDAGNLIFAGVAAMRRGELARALELLTQATLCKEGDIDEAYFNLGGVFLALRRYGDAAECYREALKIDPADAIYQKRLADVERLLG